MTDVPTTGLVFSVLNEIGIIEQLSRTVLETHLPDGMITPHFSVLSHLIRVEDGQTPIQLAKAFQVPKTSMTHTLKVLEARAMIALRPNPEDGRSKRVWITHAGRALRNDVIDRLGPDLAWIADTYGVERFAELLPHLRDLRILLDANREAASRRPLTRQDVSVRKLR